MASSTDTTSAKTAPTYTRPRSHRSIPGDLSTLGASIAAQGHRAALEAFYNDVMTLDGNAARTMQHVVAGGAPQEFKDAFVETLTALSAMFDQRI